MPLFKIYTSKDGKPDEYVGEFAGSEWEATQICFAAWPEYQEMVAARDAWMKDRSLPCPEWHGGSVPPFEILRPDGTFFPWDRTPEEDDEEEDDEAEEGSPVVLDETVSCQRCGSHRVADAGGKTSDRSNFSMGSIDHDGYVPEGVGIGGDDYIEITYCLDCGQLQGTFPLPISDIEKGIEE